MLSDDVLEKIADFSDIDSRRFMGYKPKKINKNILTNMNTLIKNKYNSIYTIYDGEIVSIFRNAELNNGTGKYLAYNYHHNCVNIIHMTGLSDRPIIKVVYLNN